MNWTQGADLSRYQRRPDFAKLDDAGVEFVIIKATENMAVDPDFDWNRNEAEKRGKAWLPYPFLRPGDNDATINHFLDVVGEKVPPALDWEAAGTPAAIVERWIGLCEARNGRDGLAYYGLYPPAAITPTITRWPRWLPQYPGSATAACRLPLWSGGPAPADWWHTALVWQWTGSGRLPGLSTAIDLNRIACGLDDFLTWYRTGRLGGTAQPIPAPASPPRPGWPAPLRLLHLHCSGPDVLALQRQLDGTVAPCDCDGVYGPQTEAVVRQFEKSVGLQIDGVAGPKVVAALSALKAAP